MGIKHFFMWFKKNFTESIHNLPKEKKVEDLNIEIDNLMIDLNGLFHTSSQKIYEYGNFKREKSRREIINSKKMQHMLFQDVCLNIQNIFDIVKPKKKLILCVDGVAPIAKQNQQRQRRFRNAKESNCVFDSNCITPGTRFMDYLSKYIDWYLKNSINTDTNWQNIEVIFSNEKVPGEGEHKIMNYIRKYGIKTETYCMFGLDSDLIMLALATHFPNFYILREDLYDKNNLFFIINIGHVYDTLCNILEWQNDKIKYIKENAINDFVFLCFIVGNDFLPHIPSFEIIENGIELIIEVYKEIGSSYGHITYKNNDKVEFVTKSLKAYLEMIGRYEKENFEIKLIKKKTFFSDYLLEESFIGNCDIDIDKYKELYNKNHFIKDDYNIEKICHDYLEGMQWVLTYYTKGLSNWEYYFKFQYSPFASDLAIHIDTFKNVDQKINSPITPFQQLLCVLPPKSSKLIPFPLNKLLYSPNPLNKYCPENITIDLAGKRKEWEGIVVLPFVDFNLVKNEYLKNINSVSVYDKKCNIFGKTFSYKYSDKNNYDFKFYYGNITNCKIQISCIDI